MLNIKARLSMLKIKRSLSRFCAIFESLYLWLSYGNHDVKPFRMLLYVVTYSAHTVQNVSLAIDQWIKVFKNQARASSVWAVYTFQSHFALYIQTENDRFFGAMPIVFL